MSSEPVEFQFVPPPDAPVFKPTWEEFQDALGYINKIRPIAEQTGICKIVPPPDWQPPFAVDIENFKFTPRIQRLNELEAHTRIKLNFLDQIAKFWELQGSSLKIPVVERRALDLHLLHSHVQSEGGLETVNRDRKWAKIQSLMGYPPNKVLGSILKGHYERIIHPYHIFNKGKSVALKREPVDDSKEDKDYKPHKIPSRMAGKIPESEKNGRRSRRYPENQPEEKVESDDGDEDGKGNSTELRRLQFYGAGPKMAGFDTDTSAGSGPTDEKGKTRGKKIDYYDYDPLAKYICLNCGRGDSEDQMLLCDGCDDSYHTFCLVPSLPDIPKGDWRCPKCVALEVNKPLEAFGFEQAQKEYSLQSFGEMADKFKQDYFNMPVHLVPLTTVEKEFWRIVSSIDQDVTVEYGADLHSMDHGSGFPTRNSKNLLPADHEYTTSSWNLNNIPVVEGSVLGHINCDISGMKVPWMYVGMCFSTFCWHNEDHWSYSINYLHWGEPKTWYGVPGSLAEKFENSMKDAARELFDAQPDLLHQLVTIMNPNIIMKSGVPIYRTFQNAGEFVITFPRAYHAGFNQGYNFAEAVNFCSADWLSVGRECILHYSNLKRYCVFSHDELVCKMGSNPGKLDLPCAAATYQDLLKMVDAEKMFRKKLLDYGIRNAEREAFELLPDDERQCDFCKTTCFLSALSCKCSSDKLVCLRHYKLLCDCPPEDKTLRYRYTLDEMPPMLAKLKARAESFDTWAARVKDALEAKPDDKLELYELRELVEEAEQYKFPDSDLLQTLIQAVTEADKCSTVAAHLAAKKVRTRTRGVTDPRARLTLEELTLFNEQIESLACIIKEGDSVKEYLTKVNSFQEETKKMLELLQKGEENKDEELEDIPDSEALNKQLDIGIGLDVDLPEIVLLKHKVQQVMWLEEVEDFMDDTEGLTNDVIKKLLEDGIGLPPSPRIEELMGQLQDILTKMQIWEEEASGALANNISISQGEDLLKRASDIAGHMPSLGTLKDAMKKTKEWVAKVESFEESEHAPLLEAVEAVVTKGKPIPFKLEQLSLLQENVQSAHSWLDKTARTFMKKTSHLLLLEVLLPRADIGLVSAKRKKVRKEELSPLQQLAQLLDIAAEEAADPAAVVKAYKECEERELRAMRAIRAHNKNKSKFDDLSTFCVCHKASHGTMVSCTLCSNQFHVTCVPVHHRNKVRLGNEGRFICMSCERSKRPCLEVILLLLVSLQKIPIRLPEAEALQCLTERAMLWQDRARTLLQTDEVAVAVTKLSVVSRKLIEAKEKEETENVAGPSNNGAGCYQSIKNALLGGGTPLITLQSGAKQQVQDLLVEGELLEVNLEEVFHLWRIHHATTHLPLQIENMLIGMNDPNPGSSPKEEAMKTRKKRRSDAAQDVPSPSQSSKSPMKKIKMGLAEKGAAKAIVKRRFTGEETGQGQTLGSKPRKKSLTVRKEKRSDGTLLGAYSSDSEDADEECAAKACQKPFGSNVQWVQCDGCDLWFHYVCVGLKPKDISEDDEYLCRICKPQP